MLYDDPSLMRKRNLKRMQIVRRITYVCGINMSEPSRWKRLLVIHALVVTILSSYSVYGHICHIIFYISDVSKITESLCTCLQTLISIFKLITWIVTEKRFYKLVKTTVESAIFNEVKILSKRVQNTRVLREKVVKIIERCWQKAQFQMGYYVTACIVVISFYFFNALLTNSYHQIKGHKNVTMQFGFYTRYPGLEEAKQHLPLYALFTVVEGYACFSAGMVAATFDIYYAYLTLHAVALFKSLKEMIQYTASSSVAKQDKVFFLQECIRHYERSIRFCNEISSLYSVVNISQLLTSLIGLGVVLFVAEEGLEKNPKTFINMMFHIGASGYQLVIYCFDGQSLASETEAISEEWYSTNWYDESKEYKRIVYMMMIRCSRTYYISAAGFTTMSRQTFLAVVRTSWSYFMLLRNISNI